MQCHWIYYQFVICITSSIENVPFYFIGIATQNAILVFHVSC